jgi:hypothetical protein
MLLSLLKNSYEISIIANAVEIESVVGQQKDTEKSTVSNASTILTNRIADAFNNFASIYMYSLQKFSIIKSMHLKNDNPILVNTIDACNSITSIYTNIEKNLIIINENARIADKITYCNILLSDANTLKLYAKIISKQLILAEAEKAIQEDYILVDSDDANPNNYTTDANTDSTSSISSDLITFNIN